MAPPARHRHPVGSEQAARPCATGTAHARISEGVRGEHGRPEIRRPGRRSDLYLHSARHAARHDGGVPDGRHHPAGSDLHAHRIFQPDPPHLHRRPRLPEGVRARLPRLLDRQVGRRGRRWQIRRARGRDPQHEGPALVRCQRPAAARRQRHRDQGAHLSRQEQSRCSHRRGHHLRQGAHAALDRDQEIRARDQERDVVRVQLHREQPPRPDRQGQLLCQRRRLPDAGAQGPGAARPEIFQGRSAVTPANFGATRTRRITMLKFSLVASVALMSSLASAQTLDLSKYPDWSGQWKRPPSAGIQWDQTKRPGRDQQPPLTPEYQAIFEASLADQAKGGQGENARVTCTTNGMPRVMTVIRPIEFVIAPKITYVIFESYMPRRIYTDSRSFPTDQEPAMIGYSIGNWKDEDGDGKYDLLEVETRNFKGPRNLEATGLPLHRDNQTVVKERIRLDKSAKDTR